MKIILLGTTANSVIGFRAEMIVYLINRGYDVYAFAIDYDTHTASQVRALGAKPVNYKLSRTGINPLTDLLSTIKLFYALKKINPDVVFSYFSKPSIFGTLAAHFCGTKKIFAMLEGLGYLFTERPQAPSLKVKFLKRIQVNLYKLAFNKLNGLILLNEDDRKDLIEIEKIKVKSTHILGGIGLNLDNYPFSAAPLLPVTFIFVGRMLVDKGVFEFIRAAKKVKSKHKDVRFIMLGSLDPYNPASLKKEELDNLISENIIEYPGHVDDVSSWLSKASVFVLPSYREGLPRSTQEAMAIGRAILTSDVPGCRQTVIDGANGYLVEKWSHDSLADKMFHLIDNPHKIVEMGLVSYDIARQNYDSKKVNADLLDYLDL